MNSTIENTILKMQPPEFGFSLTNI